MTDADRLTTMTSADQSAYSNYLRVRDEVARLKRASVQEGDAAPSRYWAEELSNIDYLTDASPLVIRKLRHHAFHVTGIRPYDYREHGERQAPDARSASKSYWFERRLRALIDLAGGADLLVDEPEALGGFGFRIDGRLLNVDTLKFFEVLVGMRRAGVLDSFGGNQPRRLLCEIGAGWGGFAYQFKTLFPDTTYVILDFPELFLFSATYLTTVFPDAKIRFWRDGATIFDRWAEADFIFIPNDRAEALEAVRPDLLVNLVSFQEMTAGQVEAYVRLAAAIGCPSVYSLNRDRSHYNEELDSVRRVLSQAYDLREIRLLGSDYTKATKRDSAVSVDEAARAGRVDEERYRHLVGSLKPISGRHLENRSRDSRGQQLAPEPLVGIGVPLHNRASYLPEALDSLLSQTYSNLQLVLVDDGSTDGTEAIAQSYAGRARARYLRFGERQGMVATWQRAFDEATAEGAKYFAWASDHDRWGPDWLRTLVDTLEQNPDVVLAYPLTQRIDPQGEALAKPARQFETFGLNDFRVRWTRFSRSDSVAAGDMIYGLIRVDALKQTGGFPEVLSPDRLLLAELSLRGQIRQVPEVLWFRRQFTTGSIERQRMTLFQPGTKPPSALVAPWYMHARSLWIRYGRDVPPPLGMTRLQVAGLIAEYAAAFAVRHYAKSSVQRGVLSILGWPRWVYKRAKHLVLLTVYRVLVATRPWRGHA
jgi:hypothetical protein